VILKNVKMDISGEADSDDHGIRYKDDDDSTEGHVSTRSNLQNHFQWNGKVCPSPHVS
jgi:hypothetical protein